MNIVGKGSKVIDADLLARLAVDRTSGSNVTKTEVAKALKSIKSDLKDEFASSSRGLDRAGKAVANTLELAVKSGWVKGGSTVSVIEDFLKSGDGSLKDIIKDIRADLSSSRSTGRTTYGGRTSSGGGRTSSGS